MLYTKQSLIKHYSNLFDNEVKKHLIWKFWSISTHWDLSKKVTSKYNISLNIFFQNYASLNTNDHSLVSLNDGKKARIWTKTLSNILCKYVCIDLIFTLKKSNCCYHEKIFI